jgi:uncharacterized protein YggT (Ycf19 family)
MVIMIMTTATTTTVTMAIMIIIIVTLMAHVNGYSNKTKFRNSLRPITYASMRIIHKQTRLNRPTSKASYI